MKPPVNRHDAMDYFFCPPGKIAGTVCTIEGEEFSHLVHVMRKKEGDLIRVVDGIGTGYDGRIGSIRRHEATVEIMHTYPNHHEMAENIALAVGILKNPSKFDFLVEKATELGVNRIIPVQTERTIPDHAKSDRWQKLALAAMKQSGRSRLPIVEPLTSVNDLLENVAPHYQQRVVAHEQPVGGVPQAQIGGGGGKALIILIGPEGGLTDEEVGRCFSAGFLPLYLGERRLRTETAAVVCAALAMR